MFFEGLAFHPLISSLNKMQVEIFIFFLWPFNVFYPHFLSTSFPKPKRNNVTDWPVLFLDLIYAGVCERMTHRACFTLAARPRTKSVLKSRACREEGLHSPGRSAFSSMLSPGVKMCFSFTSLEVKHVARVNLSQVAFWGGPAVLLQGFCSFHLFGVTFAAVQ